MKVHYNKLVRDKIPQIIFSGGELPIIEVLDDSQYLTELDNKLDEEVFEYQRDKSLEELADVLEVIYAITEARGFTVQQLQQCREKKRQERGGFAKRIFLLGKE